ncbi:MAG: hypothetical protein HY451_00710 [Parcubacteria group bacterium]|nr:hypothetical protein [Parcubacteria group bacterium]
MTIDELNIYDPYDVYISRNWGDHFKYNQIHDKIQKLPDNLSDFLFDLKVGDFIKERIAIPFNLTRDGAQEIGIIILELTVSDIYLGNIAGEIKSRLGIDDQKAKTIAGLIVAELFAPILEDLKKMHIQKFARNIPKPSVQNNQSFDDRVIDLKNSDSKF